MQTVILAAGRGTRMSPLSESLPKPMLPVGSKPMSAHVADAAVEAGADELVFVVGYEGGVVREFFGSSYAGVPVEYAEQGDPTGTADAVAAASDHLDGTFAVLNGDNLYDADSLGTLFDRGPGVGGYRVDDPSSYGVLETNGEGIDGIIEKPDEPPSRLVNAGAYVFPAGIVDRLDVPRSERGEYELTDVVNRIVEDSSMAFVELDSWLDIGRPWELLDATASVLERQEREIAGEVHPRAELEGTVVVEEGATVEQGVTIEGPAYLRSGASVGPNAYVRGATLLGRDVHVGHGVEIKNSVLMDGTAVPHLSYVGDSVLGRNVNLGAGTNVANLRHDGAEVELTVKGERVSTGRRKFGVVVGDRASTGINTSINPGVTLSSDATTRPGETVTRDR